MGNVLNILLNYILTLFYFVTKLIQKWKIQIIKLNKLKMYHQIQWISVICHNSRWGISKFQIRWDKCNSKIQWDISNNQIIRGKNILNNKDKCLMDKILK